MNGFQLQKKLLKRVKEVRLYIRYTIILLIPLGLIAAVSFFSYQAKEQKQLVKQNALLPAPLALTAPMPYPLLRLLPQLGASSIGQKQFLSTISTNYLPARAGIIIDDDAKVVLFAKNETSTYPMASTTKIMTALVGLDTFKFDDVLTVQSEQVEGAVVGLRKGERYTFENILYAMLLPSGNDAAVAIAQNFPGGENAFVAAMNDKAAEYHLTTMHFADPTGLSELNDTSALDLSRLASIAMKHDTFAKIAGTKSKIITDLSGTHRLSIGNLNRLLGTGGVNGIKTGFTEEAGGVLVTSRSEGGHLVIIVVMGSLDRFADTELLLRLVSHSIDYIQIAS